ncbi:SGNH/GDSL hydrolase family protein [Novosphingobium resinovorum]|uniref:SGNH/GDSL hydrolase family protein n=1 Tax=Novosphingobium resinovorum TaxID=158500 RepID=UPI002ED4F9F6|nr:SGNH/GDSL hydrolase family protein [Novosphingobium resinovorum]
MSISKSIAGLALACALTGPSPALAQYWSRSWMAAPLVRVPAPTDRPSIVDATVRQVVRISSGGKALRLRVSNELSDAPLVLGEVHVALADTQGRIVAGTDRVLTFSGRQGATVPGRAPLLSDPVAMPVKPLTRLAVTIHLPVGATLPTEHSYSAATAWVAPGNQVGAVQLEHSVPLNPRLLISAVEVETARRARTVVTLGDSITDGVRATPDSDRRWPDLLAERLQQAGLTDVGVANAGISANRLLSEGDGQNALARFDRDVLAVPGVSHVIVLEGVNDIGTAARDGRPIPTFDDMIGAYRQIIARAHEHGVKVTLATILPYKDAKYWSAEGEAVREAVNAWILRNDEADGAADLAASVADPADPRHFAAPYDSGDALHPNDAGFARMAAAVRLADLK